MWLEANQKIEMTEEEIQLIEKRCAAATKGPWKSLIEGRDHESGSDIIQTGGNNPDSPDIELIGATVEDQEFIASARQDVPCLIEEIRKLRRQLKESSK